MTPQDLQKIFYSNFSIGSDWESLEEISLMLEEKMLVIKQYKIASTGEFEKRIEEVLKPSSKMIRTGESYNHIALKTLGADFLKENYNVKGQDVFYEYPLIGFEVDLIDNDLHYPIECGDTNASKLEKYLTITGVKNFSIIPYPHLKMVILFQFTATKLFFKYINFKKQFLNKKRATFR